MDKLERAKRLKNMLSQIAGSRGLESVAPAGLGTSGGLESVSPEGTNVRSGLEKLADNRHQDITPNEMFGLEAIVMKENRPVVFVRGNSYDDVGNPWSGLNTPQVKTRLSSLFPLIGRIELPNSTLVPYAGTGFVVGKGLIATNRHVAQEFSRGLGVTIQYRGGDAAIDFKRQVDTPEDDHTAYLTVRGVEMIHPYWDMALLQVDGLPTDQMLRLSVRSPEDLVNHNVVAVGYPAPDPRNDVALQDKIFGGVYYVKRLQPGVVRARAQVQSFENEVNAMTHDASTLGGNSGSAIIDVDSGEVVALHFAGEYLKANYAVPMFELARDSRVASKLNFDGQIAATSDFDPAWRSLGAEATAAPAQASPPPQPSAPSAPLQSPQAPTHVEGESTWIIPLWVTVSVGTPSRSSPTVRSVEPAVDQTATLASEAELGVEAEEAVVVNQDYSDRPGYDPNFLDNLKVPLPSLSEAMKQDTATVRPDAQRNGDPYELAYYHYSVYLNKRRRTAWFSAANIDGDKRQPIGKREGDRWYLDTRVDRSEQLGQEAYEHGIDRGHLTRRDDTAWGDDVKSATAANNDTFHFTNCALQASPFNRGKDRWQGLEQFLLEQHAKKDRRRMTVITGPLFSPNDPVYKNDRMKYSVRCPLQYWKVCVLIRRKDDTPAATGFILGQEDIQDLPGFEAVFDVAATQIKIEDLEKKTGLDFGRLREFDHFARGGAPGTLEMPTAAGARQTVKAIRSGPDIVI
ncbi:MAG: DNA/RNA non-specific endonuclease [Hyphomicrobiales bacterium]|nr:DNA/RNA non-specific endonuclease [Hyphomicrobiales bacterium]